MLGVKPGGLRVAVTVIFHGSPAAGPRSVTPEDSNIELLSDSSIHLTLVYSRPISWFWGAQSYLFCTAQQDEGGLLLAFEHGVSRPPCSKVHRRTECPASGF